MINSVLVSSTKKANIISVSNGVITLANTTAVLTVGDELTIEIDVDNVAKESNATSNKNEIIAAIPTVNQIQNGLATLASVSTVSNKIGTAPAGSDKATLFAWLTTIYEYLAGQTPEDIPEGLGDRINLLLQFFGLPQVLPEYQPITEAEVKDINDDVMGALYGYGKVTVTIHALMRTGAETTQDLASVIYVDPEKTWAQNGYPTLYDDEGTAIDTTTNPSEGDEVYLYQITQNS